MNLLFFITEDWFFYSHFLNRALGAQHKGYNVSVITHTNEHWNELSSLGINIIHLNLSRRSSNPIKEFKIILELIRIFRKYKPDIVQNIALKPIIYGTIASFFSDVPVLINAPVGLGYAFSSKEKKAAFIKLFILSAYRFLLNQPKSYVIMENSDDYKMMKQKKFINSKRSILIRGAGVDTSKFVQKSEPIGDNIVILASRLLWDKGILEFVEAAKILQIEKLKCRMILIGKPDPENPASIPEKTLYYWHSRNIIEFWGYRENMPEIFAQSNIIVLPSYREGLPKVLIEAASCGRAIIATDVPGCREIVRHNDNGILIPPRDSRSLAEAIRYLIDNPNIRKNMGKRGREIVISEFSEEIVVNKTMELYNLLTTQ